MNINNKEIDKEPILFLIKENKIIGAIKYVREITNIGLKDSKEVVDNLTENSNFYDTDTHFFKERNSIINTLKKSKNRKGNHVIKKRNNHYKIMLFIILITFLYFYFFMTEKAQ